MEVHFVLILLSFLTANSLFGDDPYEVKSVTVTEGESVTLHTDVVKQRDDLILWIFGSENTVVAKINGEANSIKFSKDEMFKDGVKMNHQTGDLIITNITSNYSGLYTLRISRNMKVSYKNFSLTVNGRQPVLALNPITKHSQDPDNTQLCLECSESPDQRLSVITAVCCIAVFCVIFIIIIYMKKRKVPVKSSESENLQTVEMRSINTISTCEDEESSKCLNEEQQQHWIEAGSV